MKKNDCPQLQTTKSAAEHKTIAEVLSERDLDFDALPETVVNAAEVVHKALAKRTGVSYRGANDETSWRRFPAGFNIPEPTQKSFSMRTEKLPGAVVLVPWSGQLRITPEAYVRLLSDTDEGKQTTSEIVFQKHGRIFLVLYDRLNEGEAFKTDDVQMEFPVVFLETVSMEMTGAKENIALISNVLGDLGNAAQDSRNIEKYIKTSNEKLREKQQLEVALAGPFKNLPPRYKALEILRWVTIFPAAILGYFLMYPVLMRWADKLVSFIGIDSLNSLPMPFLLLARFCFDFLIAGFIISIGRRWIPRNAGLAGILLLATLILIRIAASSLVFVGMMASPVPLSGSQSVSLLFSLLMGLSIGIGGFIAGWVAAKKGWGSF